MWGRHLHPARSWAGRSQWTQFFCPPWPNDWLQPGAQPYSHCLGGPGGEPSWQQSCQGERGWPTDSSLYTAASCLSGHRSCDHVSPQPPLSFVYNWFTGPSRLSPSLHQKPGGSACWSSAPLSAELQSLHSASSFALHHMKLNSSTSTDGKVYGVMLSPPICPRSPLPS